MKQRTRRTRIKWTLTLAFIALFHSAEGTAHADELDDARAALLRGNEAVEQGDPERALTEYDTAKRLAPLANAPYFFAAEALEKMGRWRAAVENLEAYLAKDPSVSDALVVRERIAKLRAEHYPARLHVITNDEATVAVDGESKGPPGTFELPAGKHRLEARAAGRTSTAKDVNLVGDTDTTISLVIWPVRTDVPPTNIPVEESPWRTVGWVVAGVGAATVATSFLLDVTALDSKLKAYAFASDNGQPNTGELRDQADTLQTSIIASYVTGGVLVLGGLALVLLAPSTRRATPSAWLRRSSSTKLSFIF